MTSRDAWETLESWLGEYSFINEQKIIKKDLEELDKYKNCNYDSLLKQIETEKQLKEHYKEMVENAIKENPLTKSYDELLEVLNLIKLHPFHLGDIYRSSNYESYLQKWLGSTLATFYTESQYNKIKEYIGSEVK